MKKKKESLFEVSQIVYPDGAILDTRKLVGAGHHSVGAPAMIGENFARSKLDTINQSWWTGLTKTNSVYSERANSSLKT